MAKWKKVDFEAVGELKAGTYLRITDIREGRDVWTEIEGKVKGEWFERQGVPSNYLTMNFPHGEVDVDIYLDPSFKENEMYEVRITNGLSLI
jgi:hypothetical protein